MNDDLHRKSNDELNELFIAEVSGWKPLDPPMPQDDPPYYLLNEPAAFVHIEPIGPFILHYSPNAPVDSVYFFEFILTKISGLGDSPLRAACIAAIRAKRATK